MLWKIALYLAIAWGLVCAVITVTAFARLGFDAIRNRVRGTAKEDPKLVPVEQNPLFTMQPSRHRPG
jgi:hypothetical protein